MVSIIALCLLEEPKRKRPTKLKPVENVGQSQNGMGQFTQPKKDRENFRKTLVDIIM